MTGAYLGNTLIAYGPDADKFDCYIALGYEIQEILEMEVIIEED